MKFALECLSKEPVCAVIGDRNAVAQRSQTEINAEIYGELSTNLLKLEKVCC